MTFHLLTITTIQRFSNIHITLLQLYKPHICPSSELPSYGLPRTGSQDHKTHCQQEDKMLQPINRHCQFLWQARQYFIF